MKEQTDSRYVTRTCEKCNQPSLLLTQQVMGKATVNLVIKADLGVVAERWSCQNCDHYFEFKTETPRPSTVWLVIGIIVSVIGLTGTCASLVQIGKGTQLENTNFTLVYCFILLLLGSLITCIGFRKATIFKRNPIVNGMVPPPMEERRLNQPPDRKSRRCSCQSGLICVGDLTHSFNLLPMGTVYTFKCISAAAKRNSLNPDCKNEIIIESTWRSTVFLITAFILALIAKFIYDSGIESITVWVLFGSLLLVSLSVFIRRFWRIFLRFKYPRL